MTRVRYVKGSTDGVLHSSSTFKTLDGREVRVSISDLAFNIFDVSSNEALRSGEVSKPSRVYIQRLVKAALAELVGSDSFAKEVRKKKSA